MQILEALSKAAYRHDKSEPLRRASLALYRRRFLLRGCKDLTVLDVRRYAIASKRVDDISGRP